jgi:hypothetical protein
MTPENLLKITGGNNTAGNAPAFFHATAPQTHKIYTAF